MKQQPLIENRENWPDCPEVKTARGYRGEPHFLLGRLLLPPHHNPGNAWKWELLLRFVCGNSIKIEGQLKRWNLHLNPVAAQGAHLQEDTWWRESTRSNAATACMHWKRWLIDQSRPEARAWHREGLTSGGKSSSGYSTQLIRAGSSGSFTRTGERTGAVVAAGESLQWRGERRGDNRDHRKQKAQPSGTLVKLRMNGWTCFIFWGAGVPSHHVLAYRVGGGIKQKQHPVLSLSQHGLIMNYASTRSVNHSRTTKTPLGSSDDISCLIIYRWINLFIHFIKSSWNIVTFVEISLQIFALKAVSIESEPRSSELKGVWRQINLPGSHFISSLLINLFKNHWQHL